MCPKEQQDNIFSRQYLFCRVYPWYWTPPSCWRPWRPRVWGSDIAIQTPKHRGSSFWFQRSHYLHFFSGEGGTLSWPPRDKNKQNVFHRPQVCCISIYFSLKAFKYLTYTLTNTPSGLLGFGLIFKKTGIKIDLFPAIIISFMINYSILGTSETHESFYAIKKPFISEYFNTCFHIFLIFNARAIDRL